MKYFADGGEVGINAAQAAVPGGPEFARYVGKSIQAVAVQSGGFRPPDAVLQKILGDQRIFGVEVGQDVEEPAFGEISGEARRGVGIDQRFKRVLPAASAAVLP